MDISSIVFEITEKDYSGLTGDKQIFVFNVHLFVYHNCMKDYFLILFTATFVPCA